MISAEKYARRPFYVDAVQVSEENMAEVATWCQGEVTQTPDDIGDPVRTFIKVNVRRPLTERQSRAFAGDWVLRAGSGFKVYTPKAFANSFEPVKKAPKPTPPPSAPVGEDLGRAE